MTVRGRGKEEEEGTLDRSSQGGCCRWGRRREEKNVEGEDGV